MTPTIAYMTSGLVFGLSAGLSPGPLLTLVIAETLRHGIRSGIMISMAPLLTDLPIVGVTVFLLSRLADIQPLLGCISIVGAAFLAYLGFESLAFKGVALDPSPAKPKSIRKGVVANFLNPSPYLFWFSIGGPLMVKALGSGTMPAAGFIAAFYLLLVGSKVVLAVIVGKSRRFLKSTHYVYTVRLLGLALFAFSVLFLWDGLKLTGIVSGAVSGYH